MKQDLNILVNQATKPNEGRRVINGGSQTTYNKKVQEKGKMEDYKSPKNKFQRMLLEESPMS